MPAISPHTRFLLRGSVLLIVLSALWWLLLLNPLLFLLRIGSEIPLRLLSDANSADPIRAEESGDWTFRAPVEDSPRNTAAQTRPTKIHTIEFSMPRTDIVLFTFSLPVYWAIVLAAPVTRHGIRALLWGTALVAIVEILALAAFVEINAYTILTQWRPATDGLAKWLREFGNYLLIHVIPDTAPVAIALSLHRELRSQIFSFSFHRR